MLNTENTNFEHEKSVALVLLLIVDNVTTLESLSSNVSEVADLISQFKQLRTDILDNKIKVDHANQQWRILNKRMLIVSEIAQLQAILDSNIPPRSVVTDEDRIRLLSLPLEEYTQAKAELESRSKTSTDPDAQKSWFNNHSYTELQNQEIRNKIQKLRKQLAPNVIQRIRGMFQMNQNKII